MVPSVFRDDVVVCPGGNSVLNINKVYFMLTLGTTGMGNRFVGMLSWYLNQPSRSTQPGHPPWLRVGPWDVSMWVSVSK